MWKKSTRTSTTSSNSGTSTSTSTSNSTSTRSRIILSSPFYRLLYCKIHFNLTRFFLWFWIQCDGSSNGFLLFNFRHTCKAKRLIDTPSITSDHIGCHLKHARAMGPLQWNIQPSLLSTHRTQYYLYSVLVWWWWCCCCRCCFFAINVALLFLCLFFLVYLHLYIPYTYRDLNCNRLFVGWVGFVP